MRSQVQVYSQALTYFSFNHKILCSFIIDIAIVFILNATSEVAQEAFRAMKDSVKYIIRKYGNDRVKFHIIIRHPDDFSFQSHKICFNTPHVDVTALTDAVEELQTEGKKHVPALHKDLQKATEAFESNTLKSDAEKVRSSSLPSSSPSSILGSLRSEVDGDAVGIRDLPTAHAHKYKGT